MSSGKLTILSVPSLETLKSNIANNLKRYTHGDFDDMVGEQGWNIPLQSLDVDLTPLKGLRTDGDKDAPVANSLLVWRVLHSLTPTLATQERLWVRLSHVEGLHFARARWITKKYKSTQELERDITKHFFASGLGGYRDDHAISRLWWNAKIAKQIRPDDQKRVLELMLDKRDTRQSLVERSFIYSRKKLASRIIHLMDTTPEMLEQYWFRRFTITVNKYGGGMVFELLDDSLIDKFLLRCLRESENAPKE